MFNVGENAGTEKLLENALSGAKGWIIMSAFSRDFAMTYLECREFPISEIYEALFDNLTLSSHFSFGKDYQEKFSVCFVEIQEEKVTSRIIRWRNNSTWKCLVIPCNLLASRTYLMFLATITKKQQNCRKKIL